MTLDERQLKDLQPIHLEGAPKVKGWSGTLNDLKVEKKLGKGDFGQVWAVSRRDMPLDDTPDTDDNIPNRSSLAKGRLEGARRYAMFAAKIANVCDTDSDEEENEYTPERLARKEARLVMSLRHKHVVKCYGAFQNASHLIAFYEYAPGGDVSQPLKKGPLAREEALSITSQILDAVNYIHQRGIVHRDIKPANIFYKYDRKQFEDSEKNKHKSHENESRDKYLVYLGDFGLAAEMEDGKVSVPVGSREYSAPEIMRAQFDTKYDAKVDIWSLGVTMYRLMIGTCPFLDNSIIDALGKPRFHATDMTAPALFEPLADYFERHGQKIVAKRFENDPVRDFLLGCLTIDPKKRKADKGILDSALDALQDANNKRRGFKDGFSGADKWNKVAQPIRRSKEGRPRSERAQTPSRDASSRRMAAAKSTKAAKK